MLANRQKFYVGKIQVADVGRQFLRELYQRLESTPNLNALTVTEALERHTPQPLSGIFPGSWISANFDVWIGFDEDNRAWEHLLKARQAYDKYAASVPEADRQMAYEEILIAEGSDWCWWYGPHHESANRTEFDQLYRDHLSNVYRLLGQPAPEELGRPILKLSTIEHNIRPASQIQPVIDGEITSYFEWMGAGEYKVDHRQGAMHGGRGGLEMLYYGTCGEEFSLRCVFDPMPESTQLEIRAGHGLNLRCRRGLKRRRLFGGHLGIELPSGAAIERLPSRGPREPDAGKVGMPVR